MKCGKKATCAIVSAAALLLTSGSVALSASEQTITPADYYTVCNTMSTEQDLGWKNVETELVEGVLDETCLKFTTSDAGRQLNFPIHSTGNEDAMANAEAVVFWIKTPDTVNGEATTDPDALKMYMNIFDTSSGEREMRSRVDDGSQNLTMISTKDGTVQTQPSSWYLKIPTAFEGYVVIPAAAWTDFQIQYFSEVQIWFDETAETFLLDNIGVTGDTQACITGLSELYTPEQGGEDDGKVDHTTHPDNANMVVGCGFESLDQIGYSSVAAVEIANISPDGSCLKFQPTATGGEINFPVDQSKTGVIQDAEAIVFWIKTPDVGSTCSYFGVYDQRPDEPRYEFGYTREEGSTSCRVVSAADGSVQTIQNAWYVNLPANFEGYVIFDKEMFNAPSGSNPDKTFDINHFSELKWYFEPEQPIAGEDYYVDDIGVTSDVDAYIAGLKALYGSEAAPDDHSRHPDNANMLVACGLESLDQIGYNSVTAMEISDISPDGSCLKFQPTANGGELNFNMDSNKEAFKDAEAIVFWVKTPDVAEPCIHLSVYDQRPDTDRKQFSVPDSGTSIQVVSAADGSVQTIDNGWYINIPSNFEGYVVLDKSIFSHVSEGAKEDVFSIEHMTQLKWYFEGGNPILNNLGEDYYIDDIGVTSDVDAYIAGLKALYGSEAAPDDHSRHPDNKNMSVACGLESLDQIGYNSVSVMELSDISPDGSCLRFRPSNSGGELNFNMDSNKEAFKDAQAIVFWVKTPDVAEPAIHMAVYDQRPDTDRKQFGLPNGGYSIRTVSALTGEVKTIDCSWYIDIPSNFEGYVIIDKAAFSNVNEGDSGDVFDIQYMTQLKWYFEGGTLILPNVTEDYYIDDIGVTSDVDAYIESLAELYEKDTPTDPEEPTDPGDPGDDDRPAYEEGPLAPTEGYTVKSLEAAGNEARLTWESIEGVDKYVVHLYRLGKGDAGETLYTYVKTVTADEGASSVVLTDLTALTDYAAQLVAMTSTDEIIFAYELKTFRTLEPGVELKDPSGEEPGTEEPGGEETDDGIPDTGVSLPAAAILLGLLAAGGMLALRRKSK